jgi:hypothetical protein
VILGRIKYGANLLDLAGAKRWSTWCRESRAMLQ